MRVWEDEEVELESFEQFSSSVGLPPADHSFWRRSDVPAVVGKAGASLLLFQETGKRQETNMDDQKLFCSPGPDAAAFSVPLPNVDLR